MRSMPKRDLRLATAVMSLGHCDGRPQSDCSFVMDLEDGGMG